MTKQEAERKALDYKKNSKVKSTKEFDNYYVVSTVPNTYKPSEGLYIGGAIKVDKKTGNCVPYNPLTMVKK